MEKNNVMLEMLKSKNAINVNGYRWRIYEALAKVLEEGDPDAVITEIENSGLRGRGGGGCRFGAGLVVDPRVLRLVRQRRVVPEFARVRVAERVVDLELAVLVTIDHDEVAAVDREVALANREDDHAALFERVLHLVFGVLVLGSDGETVVLRAFRQERPGGTDVVHVVAVLHSVLRHIERVDLFVPREAVSDHRQTFSDHTQPRRARYPPCH